MSRPEGDDPRRFLVRNLIPAILVVALVGGLSTTALVGVRETERIAAQEQRIGELEDELSATQQRRTEAATENLTQSLGITDTRVAADSRMIGELLATAFDWSSGVEFETAREDIKADYGLAEDGAFLRDFLPPSRFNVDSSGRRYYFIDAEGMTSTLAGDPQIEVVRATGTTYEYAVLADVQISTVTASADEDRTGYEVTQIRSLFLETTIEGDGTITELSGVPASGSPKTAR